MNKEFSEKTKKEAIERCGGICEIYAWLENQGEFPKDFPKIDPTNPYHTTLEHHHANFKSSEVPWLNELWNDVVIAKFYHDLIHADGKWGKILADFCRSLAESRRPQRTDAEWQEVRMADHGKKLSKPKTKAAPARKENPWIQNRKKEQKNPGKIWGVTSAPKQIEKGKRKPKKIEYLVSPFFKPKK